ncbi:MAG: glycosyltransferase family 4 protein [Myxococcota bacterium]|nr:glycosyltransferase family 4 protein [Myxococcota bacterium]
MRVLQVTGDWKWTGPAEPMLRLALGLRERGHDVRLACPPPPPGADRALLEEARKRELPPDVLLSRGRGLHPLRDRGDVAALRRVIEREAVDVVHAWHTRDHLLALRAARPRRRAGATAVVRSWRKAGPPPATPWDRWLFGPGTDGLLCVSPGTAARLAPRRGGRPVRGAFGAVDLARFAPEPAPPGLRAALGLAEEDRVVGIVARVQPHRRFDVLLAAFARLVDQEPRARLLVVGRGTRRRALAEEPARRMGLGDRVVFAGYRREDYAAVLRCIDVFTFLVPGSDGTCRALLEAAACGIPAVTTRRGALPEIVVDGETGILCDETPPSLAAGWRALLADDVLRRRMGHAAHERALRAFTPERLAETALALYREALA